MAMKITLWGTRGGVPVSGSEFERHGGSTTHLELDLGDRIPQDRLLIDCGTGIVSMGRERGDSIEEALVFQTHMHWDHIQGFPFFEPLFDPSGSFRFIGVDRGGCSVERIYSAQMKEPTFPVEMDALRADLAFESLPEEGERAVGDATIAWTELEHPSGSSALRVEADDEVFVFSGDVEVRQGSSERLVEFASGANVFIMDAQYLPGEYDRYEGFGHSTCRDAVRVAERAGVDTLYLTHHDPTHGDSVLERKESVARDLAGDDLAVENARDRQRILISSSGGVESQTPAPRESDIVRGY